MQDRPLRDDEYDDDDGEAYRTDRAADPVSDAVGSSAFVENHRIDECFRSFAGGIHMEPERFDRFYFSAEPPLLIDILPDFTEDQLTEARSVKHVEFKAAWCDEHDHRYVALNESEAEDPNLVRELLKGKPGTEKSLAATATTEGKRAPRKRGQVSRPKATA